MTNSICAENTRWGLGFLYSGINDPQIDQDAALFTAKAKSFRDEYRGELAEKLGDAIALYAEMDMLGNKVLAYLFLQQSLNVSDPVVKAKIAEVERAMSHATGEYLTFFELELVALDDTALEKLYASNPVAARHRPWIEHLRVFKPHLLTEPVESALTKRRLFGDEAWSEFFDELEADLSFDFRGEKKTLTEMLHTLSESKDATERSECMKTINEGFNCHFAKYSAQTLYVVAGLEAIERKERGYRHPMDSRNKSNRIPDAVVGTLHKAVVTAAGPLARRYYRLKAAHLGLKTLRWSDRNAPMPFASAETVPFDKAMATTLKAYESFSPTLAGIIRDCVAEKRIDAPATKGKRGGAFNYSIILPGNKPASFTFLNYLGSARDVMTLAHELGHGVHGMLAGAAQGTLMFHAPIAYCETASVFGEMVTFNFLKNRLAEKNDRASMLALVMGKIDDVVNTMVRQIGFSNFERRLHGMDPSYSEWREPKKLSVEELDEIWLQTLKELYGDEDEVFTYENAEHLWAYVGHFHRPFYVYGYAFGELLTHSLYAERERLGKNFEPLYLELLRAGSTKNVVELLRPFGLDPENEKFWLDGIEVSLGTMLREAEKLSSDMGITIS